MTNENQMIIFDKLTKIFYKNDKAVRSKLSERLYEKKILTPLEFLKIWGTSVSLDEVDLHVVCAIYVELAAICKLEPASKYFDAVTIQESMNIKTSSTDLKYPIVFKNVTQLNSNYFIIPMHISLINKLQSSKLLIRDKNAQRETIIKKTKNGEIEYLKTNDRAIEEIKTSLLNGEYYPDALFFNLNSNGSEDFYYSPDTNSLTIKQGMISLIDGNHRVLAIEKVMSENPQLDIYFPVIFTALSLQEAQSIIVQLEKKMPINKKRVKSLVNSNSNKIIKAVRDNTKLSATLSRKIVDTAQQISSGIGIFILSDLSDAVDVYYNDVDINRDMDETEAWLVAFLNMVSFAMKDYFVNSNSRKTTWIYKPVFAYVIIKLSKSLEDTTNWKEKLETILNQMDFSIESKLIVNTKNPKKAVDNLFEEMGL